MALEKLLSKVTMKTSDVVTKIEICCFVLLYSLLRITTTGIVFHLLSSFVVLEKRAESFFVYCYIMF